MRKSSCVLIQIVFPQGYRGLKDALNSTDSDDTEPQHQPQPQQAQQPQQQQQQQPQQQQPQISDSAKAKVLHALNNALHTQATREAARKIIFISDHFREAAKKSSSTSGRATKALPPTPPRA